MESAQKSSGSVKTSLIWASSTLVNTIPQPPPPSETPARWTPLLPMMTTSKTMMTINNGGAHIHIGHTLTFGKHSHWVHSDISCTFTVGTLEHFMCIHIGHTFLCIGQTFLHIGHTLTFGTHSHWMHSNI